MRTLSITCACSHSEAAVRRRHESAILARGGTKTKCGSGAISIAPPTPRRCEFILGIRHGSVRTSVVLFWCSSFVAFDATSVSVLTYSRRPVIEREPPKHNFEKAPTSDRIRPNSTKSEAPWTDYGQGSSSSGLDSAKFGRYPAEWTAQNGGLPRNCPVDARKSNYCAAPPGPICSRRPTCALPATGSMARLGEHCRRTLRSMRWGQIRGSVRRTGAAYHRRRGCVAAMVATMRPGCERRGGRRRRYSARMREWPLQRFPAALFRYFDVGFSSPAGAEAAPRRVARSLVALAVMRPDWAEAAGQ